MPRSSSAARRPWARSAEVTDESAPGSRSPAAVPPMRAAELARLRAEIDRVDRALLGLLNERATLGRARSGRWKERNGMPVYSAARERDLSPDSCGSNPRSVPECAPSSRCSARSSPRRARSRRALRVAFLGPGGHLQPPRRARTTSARRPSCCPVPTIGDVFGAVERGQAELGVVPVENTTEGVVTQTLDAFVELRAHDLRRGVAAHLAPPALAQRAARGRAARRVDRPGARAVPRLARAQPAGRRARRDGEHRRGGAASRAEDASVAAIGSRRSRRRSTGSRRSRPGIEDRRDNTTRFLLLGRDAPRPQRSRSDRAPSSPCARRRRARCTGCSIPSRATA